MANVKDLKGMRFGKLLVLQEEEERHKSGSVLWLCKCDCGNQNIVSSTYLINRDTKSCGCLHKAKLKNGNPKHGMCGTKFYNSWYGMKRRCTDKKHVAYYRYGGNGITVCDKWLDFKGFMEDMYSAYKKGLQIDRIDYTKGYNKENCRWVSVKKQANNKSNNRILYYRSKKYTLAELSEEFNINYGTLKSRLNTGMSVEDAINVPVQDKSGRR